MTLTEYIKSIEDDIDELQVIQDGCCDVTELLVLLNVLDSLRRITSLD